MQQPFQTRCCWAGAGLLVTVSREAFVRLWRLRSGGKEGKAEQAHYLMALQDGSEKGSRLNKDVAVSIAFDPVGHCYQKEDIAFAVGVSGSTVWDLGRGAAMAAAGAAPKALGAPRSINNIGEGQVVESVAANCNGSRVSLLVSRPVKTADGVPRRQIDSRVIFYDIVNDILSSKDCKASDILYTPVSHMWDQRDPRVMACQGRDGVLPVALATPYIYFYDQVDGEITKVCQRSFSGMEAACDGPQGASTAKALIDFSFYLAKGNADAAYRAVRAVDSLAVWENLCRMAVKTRQLQVARRCLGRIQASGGGVHGVVTGIPAAALRASFVLREAEAKGDFATDEEELAAIAVHLGMIEEAEEHYKEAPEYSKLNKLYQKLGRWSDSIAVAEVHDRMHLPSTHFACAKSLEARGDVDGALKKYEEAGSAGLSEIPRMFLRFGLFQQLREYIDRAEKPCLYKWYGQYLESMGNAEEAEQYYRKAEDWATLVRLSWVKSDLDGARRICRESGDSDATYQHAKYLQQYCVEGKEELLKEAVESYSVAGRVGAALRLAQSYDMEAEVRFYESKGNYARAAALYQKIGQTDKAISLCLATRQYDALRKLADDLTLEITDTATVEKCVKVLIEREYYDKAVQILANTDQLEKAVGMCEDYNVSLTEELAEKLTPKDRDHPRYKDLLLAIGEMAKKQGLYAVACKKFTQAGDKIAAMKALLRSGDTEKIIFYAQTARTKEVFVLAANNLQSLDWYNNPEVEKNIIAFYTRAKAAEMLARFHEARAHRAIDEHQDVDAAIAALEEAVTVVERVRELLPPAAAHLSAALNASLQVLRKFAEARRSASTDPRASLVACGGMLQSSELTQSPLRPGDVLSTISYAFMAHLFDHNGQTSDAAEVVKRMIQENITPSSMKKMVRLSTGVYIPRQLLQRIGFGGLPKEASDEQAEGEVIEEEIVEDIAIS
ncbi:conserved hypothetical protein [Perkinsus marinus ATCC 50983]|uniref:Intraflagellar transport protein 140 n=1 Tax=Perkinsus marinus (strain ATCC 50983 / TXsc) TaxID=423536 RepID=C5KCW1_PERM5|nr:conserved hypothetical protein [Perkinsus marinus ATCC 50983]EER17710.1 conserved hypothetical protein [Perkinsus marinus ATCC 50983]|eukprot:XP_002785914.1 conserved hypothetical protein [Perkinsus marinus ATCC 50983]